MFLFHILNSLSTKPMTRCSPYILDNSLQRLMGHAILIESFAIKYSDSLLFLSI